MADRDFTEVFTRLRGILAEHAGGMDVVQDGPTGYRLNTRHVRSDGYVLMFGAVEIRARYVSYHLLPLYVAPPDRLPVPDALRRRMQGKSCLNFTRVDDALFAELVDVTARAARIAAGPVFAAAAAGGTRAGRPG